MIKKFSKYLLSAAILLFAMANKYEAKPFYLGAYRTTSITTLLNSHRKSSNLPVLYYSGRLSGAAHTRAITLFNNGQWSHAGFQEAVDKVAKKPVLYGENLGIDIPSNATLINRWMASPTHRDNILSGNYKYIGFARYKNYAVLWFSQEN